VAVARFFRAPLGTLKVPEVTAMFWAIKLLSTALGESISDFIVLQIDPYRAVAVGLVGLLVAFVLQFRAGRYIPWVYWLSVVMVAVFGTMAADVMHKGFGIPFAVSSSMFAVALAVVFVKWDQSQHTLSIHTVTPGRRELFYWTTVMATFALGTALGDLTASGFGFGYFASLIGFSLLILVPAAAYRLVGANETAMFWTAYILTRPVGASFADWTSKSKLGGLGMGDGTVSVVLATIIGLLVGILTVNDLRRRWDRKPTPAREMLTDERAVV
jgi:uncharacterized membrane-anchored protein